MIEFFKKAFRDMKDSVAEQLEADKKSLAAARAESRADFETAKAMGKPENVKKQLHEKRKKQISEAEEKIARAETRINSLKN